MGSRQLISLVLFGALLMLACIPLVRRYGKTHRVREVFFVVFGAVLGGMLARAVQTVPAALTAAVFCALLIAVALTDADTMEIPDGYHLALLAVGVVSIYTMPGLPLSARLIGVLCVSLPMLLLCLFIPGAFGGGDIKLMVASGFFLGWKLTLLAAFFGILLGGIWGAVLLLRRRAQKTDHFAFGPFLCAGMLIALLWGQTLLHAYIALFF